MCSRNGVGEESSISQVCRGVLELDGNSAELVWLPLLAGEGAKHFLHFP